MRRLREPLEMTDARKPPSSRNGGKEGKFLESCFSMASSCSSGPPSSDVEECELGTPSQQPPASQPSESDGEEGDTDSSSSDDERAKFL